MSLLQETFVETDWEAPMPAKDATDKRAAQLQVQGGLCQCSTLYRITDRRRGYLVEAWGPEQIEVADTGPRRQAIPRQPRPQGKRPPRNFEMR